MIKKTKSELQQEKCIKNWKKVKVKPKKTKVSKTKYSILELKAMPYKQFLQTGYWKKVRFLVLKRDDNKCVICKSPYLLQVHHDTYKNHGNELKYLSDLMTLCKKCHKEHHHAQ